MTKNGKVCQVLIQGSFQTFLTALKLLVCYYSLTLTLYLTYNQDKAKFSGMIGYHRSDMACGSLWPFPSSRQFRKPQNSRTKIYLPKSALLIPRVSTSAFHSTNLFVYSHHNIPTNSISPFLAYKLTHNPQFLQSL